MTAADSSMRVRLVAGCMTGTSLDGLDAALVRIAGHGLGMTARFVRGVSRPLGELAERLRLIVAGERVTAEEVTSLALDCGRLHVEALGELLAGEPADLIVLHGQTLLHKPPLSWQLVNPWPAAAAFRTQVICDLRGADLAAGGQGAPITPLADFIMFRAETTRRIVVNLGGFINYTDIPAGDRVKGQGAARLAGWAHRVVGGDVCVGNQLLDAIARMALRIPFDEGGKAALGGRVDRQALRDLEQRLSRQSESGRSLGSGDEASDWVEAHRGGLTPADLARTACAGIAATTAARLGDCRDTAILIAGGGARNQALVAEIEQRCECSLRPTNDFGMPIEYREATAMAILGALAADKVPITLPQITGRRGARGAGLWVQRQT